MKVKIVASAFLLEMRYQIPTLDAVPENTRDFFVATSFRKEVSTRELLFDTVAAHIHKKRVKALFYCYL